MRIVQASEIKLVSEGVSEYVILTDANPAEVEIKAAEVLQDYIFRSSDARLHIVSNDSYDSSPYIKLSNQEGEDQKQGFVIASKENNLLFTGYGKKGVLFAVYTFIEEVLKAEKLVSGEPAIVPKNQNISIESNFHLEEYPHFLYREVYSTAETDMEYLDWHKLHNMDETWGLWGHSIFKLLPPNEYWEEHPEYYSLYNGKRQPLQICFTNPKVAEIVESRLRQMIDEKKGVEFWSVSANDNIAVCECDSCMHINKEEGSASGTLIRFVNKLANSFPQKKLVTLAYQNTSWPSLVTKPEKNVFIMLSSIDVYRSEPIAVGEDAKTFRRKLDAWRKITPNILIWDYYTQFTNLLAPFPVEHTFSENMEYFHQNELYGIFAQMNEFTYGDLLELKIYMLAKLMWKSEHDKAALVDDFLKSYYQDAAPYVKEYLDKRSQAIKETRTNLDIYGNPVNNQRDYLSQYWMDSYSASLDEAEKAANSEVVIERIKRLRLPLEFTYLQQARSYGIHPHGIWHKDKGGKLVVNKNIREKVDNLYSLSKSIGIKRVSEDGVTLDEYKAEWDSTLKTLPAENLAVDAGIKLLHPHVKEYAIKGVKTLNDRLSGYNDFSYNWLSFDGVALDATIDLGKPTLVNEISMDFLENQRLWFYKPQSIRIFVSNDNTDFTPVDTRNTGTPLENYDINKYNYTFNFIGSQYYRYIRVVAEPLSYNPIWSPPTYSRKPMIACDEIWIK